MWAALHGDFGISYRLARPVAGLIAERLPATLELALTASVLALVVGVPMGVYTGDLSATRSRRGCSWRSAWSACRCRPS